MLRVNMELLVAITGTFSTLAVAAILHWSASPKVKALANLAVTAVTALAAQAITNNGLISKETFVIWIFSFAISAGLYVGFWRPAQVAQALAFRIEPGILKNPKVITQLNQWIAAVQQEQKTYDPALEAKPGITPQSSDNMARYTQPAPTSGVTGSSVTSRDNELTGQPKPPLGNSPFADEKKNEGGW